MKLSNQGWVSWIWMSGHEQQIAAMGTHGISSWRVMTAVKMCEKRLFFLWGTESLRQHHSQLHWSQQQQQDGDRFTVPAQGLRGHLQTLEMNEVPDWISISFSVKWGLGPDHTYICNPFSSPSFMYRGNQNRQMLWLVLRNDYSFQKGSQLMVQVETTVACY